MRRALVVAREHDGADAHARELGERRSASGLGLVGQRDKTCKRTVDCKEKHRLALIGKALRLSFRLCNVDAALPHEPRVTGEARTPRNLAAKSATRDLLEGLDFLGCDAARLGVCHDSLGQRVLGALLEGVRKGKESGCLSVNPGGLDSFGGTQSLGSPDSHEQSTGLFGSCETRFVGAAEAICQARGSSDATRGVRSERRGSFSHQHLAHLGRALRDGPRLVEHDRLHTVRGLQRLGRLHENAVRGAASRPHHNGGRSGKAQSTGA